MPAGDLDHLVPCRTREVRVVEHDPARAGDQLLVEGRGEVAQRPSAFVAVEPEVAPRRVVGRDAALPGAGNAHHEDDLGIAPRRRLRAAAPGRRRRRRRCRHPRRRARRLRTAGAGDRDDDGRKAEQPRERLRRVDPPGPLRPAERRVRDQRDPELRAALDDAAAQRTVVEGRERDLHRRDRRELERLVQLAAVDVREPDATDEARRRRVGRARARTSSGACADRARGGDRDRSVARRAPPGSPRSRRGSPWRGRPAPRLRRVSPCRPSSRSGRAQPRRSGGAPGRPAARFPRRRAPCRRR